MFTLITYNKLNKKVYLMHQWNGETKPGKLPKIVCNYTIPKQCFMYGYPLQMLKIRKITEKKKKKKVAMYISGRPKQRMFVWFPHPRCGMQRSNPTFFRKILCSVMWQLAERIMLRYSSIFFFFFFFFSLRDFIFKKTLFEKVQYLKQERDKCVSSNWPTVTL